MGKQISRSPMIPYLIALGVGFLVLRAYRGESANSDEVTFPSHFSILYAINADGTMKWSVENSDDYITAPVIAADGTIYVGGGTISPGGTLYRYDRNGELKFKFHTSFDVQTPVVTSGGIVYAAADSLYALDSANQVRWHFDGGPFWSPTVGPGGTIYVASQTNYVYAITPDGTKRWSRQLVSIAPPAIGLDGTVYFGSNDAHVYALTPDGVINWSYATEGIVLYPPAVGKDGTVLAVSSAPNLYALRPDGALKWSDSGTKLGLLSMPGPSVTPGGTIQIGTLALNPDGTQLSKLVSSDDQCWKWEPPLGANQTVYTFTVGAGLCALNPNGTVRWRFSGPRPGTVGIALGPAIATDGTIYYAVH